MTFSPSQDAAASRAPLDRERAGMGRVSAGPDSDSFCSCAERSPSPPPALRPPGKSGVGASPSVSRPARGLISHRKRWFAWSLAGAGCAAGAAVLFYFPPEQVRFFPRCAFNALTGLQCPGCGGLRATHQLLHGNFAVAWQLNPLVLLGAIGGLAWVGARLVNQLTGRDVLQPLRRAWLFWAGMSAIALFAVARNLIHGG